jgi:MFS family permease
MKADNVRSYFFYLSKDQREAVGLLSIGTFLEYFDLMLYVHMAVLLNELFFPKTDPFTASLITAFSFCSTYLLRPFGALIFGYIGDYIGRKAVVILTTFLMAISCIIVASLPTYAQIGIAASWIITLCRVIQGMVATAEVRGAELYLTESSKPPVQYPMVALITVFSALGSSAAIGVAAIFTNDTFSEITSWRAAFFVGAGIALVGTIARTSLKEAAEFADKRSKLKEQLKENKVAWSDLNEEFMKQKSSYVISLAYFLIQCARPPCFYFIYIYCADVLKRDFGYTANEVISQNFLVSIIDLLGLLLLAYLSYIIHPFKILKAKFYLFFASMLLFPAVLNYTQDPSYILIFQCLAALFVFDHIPASPIFYKYFPVFRRFTYTSFLSAVAKLATYFITAFGLVYTTEYLGYWGIFVILVPVGIGFFLSVSYFQKLENQ